MYSNAKMYLGGIYLGYKNGKKVLPEYLIRQIQEYVDGENIYIPRKVEYRKKWGTNTDTRNRNILRDKEIYDKYRNGHKVAELSKEYYISPQGIYRIISKQRSK